jgi:hypothetical protein
MILKVGLLHCAALYVFVKIMEMASLRCACELHTIMPRKFILLKLKLFKTSTFSKHQKHYVYRPKICFKLICFLYLIFVFVFVFDNNLQSLCTSKVYLCLG